MENSSSPHSSGHGTTKKRRHVTAAAVRHVVVSEGGSDDVPMASSSTGVTTVVGTVVPPGAHQKPLSRWALFCWCCLCCCGCCDSWKPSVLVAMAGAVGSLVISACLALRSSLLRLSRQLLPQRSKTKKKRSKLPWVLMLLMTAVALVMLGTTVPHSTSSLPKLLFSTNSSSSLHNDTMVNRTYGNMTMANFTFNNQTYYYNNSLQSINNTWGMTLNDTTLANLNVTYINHTNSSSIMFMSFENSNISGILGSSNSYSSLGGNGDNTTVLVQAPYNTSLPGLNFTTNLTSSDTNSSLSVGGNNTTNNTNTSLLEQNDNYGHVDDNVTFFYNLFLSPKQNEDQIFRTLSIVREQFIQIRRSGLLQERLQTFPINRRKDGTFFDLYYNTIGQPVNQSWFHSLAIRTGLRPFHMTHYHRRKHHEEDDSLYQYCEEHPDSIVIYLHNKEHDSKRSGQLIHYNTLRRLLTYVATHPSCIRAVASFRNNSSSSNQLVETTTDNTTNSNSSSTLSCQTCGLLFQPLPSMHYPGNMWTAACSYVRQLVPPLTFADNMERVVQTMRTKVQPHGYLQEGLFPPGTLPNASSMDPHSGPYATTEHWIASHPNLERPCQMAPSAGFDDLTFNKSALRAGWQNHDQVLPLAGEEDNRTSFPPLADHGWQFYHHVNWTAQQLYLKSNATHTDFFLLPGTLFQWKELYPEAPLPSNTSWVWKWYPDGDYWKSQLDTHPLLTTDWSQQKPKKKSSSQEHAKKRNVTAGSVTSETFTSNRTEVAEVRNQHDMILYNWALQYFANESTVDVNSSSITRSRPMFDFLTPPTCLVVFQIPKADFPGLSRTIRKKVAAQLGWIFFPLTAKTTLDRLESFDLASKMITSGVLTPDFLEVTGTSDCFRMVTLKHPIDRVLALFDSAVGSASNATKDREFEACFAEQDLTIVGSNCTSGAIHYQDDMVRLLSSGLNGTYDDDNESTLSLISTRSARYAENAAVDSTRLQQAQQFLADMDLVCFAEQRHECIPRLRYLLGMQE